MVQKKVLYVLKSLIIVWTMTQAIQASKIESQLINDLLLNYNTMARPALNDTITTFIKIAILPTKIIEVNEKDQLIKTYAWLFISWNDPDLVWDPANYSGLVTTYLHSDRLWKPDIQLSNSVDTSTTFTDLELTLAVDYDGTVYWYPYGVFTTGCSIDVRNFPYDEQTCEISFASNAYLYSQVYFNASNQTNLALYQNNTEWELISFTSQSTITKLDFQTVSFVMNIKRKPLFVVFNMMLPCIFTVLVALMSFLVPPASGEKMSIGITTLLSSSVLLLVISSELPRCSDYVPLIGAFYCTATVLIALICLASVFTLNLYHYGEDGHLGVPQLVQKIFFSKFGQIILLPRIVSMKSILDIEKHEERRKLQWTILADIVDRLFFYIFVIGTIISLSAANGSRS